MITQYDIDNHSSGSAYVKTGKGKQVNNTWNHNYASTVGKATEAPPPRLNHSKSIPFIRDPDFVDRDGLLDWVRRTAGGILKRAALYGMGGIGKSHVALEYAHSLSEPKSSPPTWVFWVRATTHAHILADFAKIAGIVGISGRDEAGVDILDLVCNWLGEEENSPWVMVFDGADNIESFSDEHPSPRSTPLKTLLQGNTYGSIILTTRDRNVAKKLFGHDDRRCITEVKDMSQPDAVELLRKKMGKTEERIDEGIVAKQKALVDELDRIPLAITQAASYIREELEDDAMTLDPFEAMSAYLDELRQLRKDTLLYNGGNPRRYEEESNSVFITWQKSFDRIQRRNSLAAELLYSMSFFDRSAIAKTDVDFAMKGQSGQDERLKEASAKENDGGNGVENGSQSSEKPISVLLAYSLIRKEQRERGLVFTMHQLVQRATRYWLEVKGRLNAVQARHIRQLEKQYPEPNYDNREVCERLYLHAKDLMNQEPTEDTELLKDWARVICRAGWYALLLKDVADADSEVLLKKAMDTMENTLGEKHRETLDSGSYYAMALMSQGNFERAESLFRELYKKSVAGLGQKDHDTLSIMGNIAGLCNRNGKFQEAESLLKEALELGKKELDENNRDVLNRKGTLAMTYQFTGRHTEATELARQVAYAHKSAHGSNDRDTMTAFSNLATTYWAAGMYDEAAKVHKKVSEEADQLLGPNHFDTLTFKANLAGSKHRQRQWKLRKEAEDEMLDVVVKSEIRLGKNHPTSIARRRTLEYMQARGGLPPLLEASWCTAEEVLLGELRSLGISHRTTTDHALESLLRMAVEDLD